MAGGGNGDPQVPESQYSSVFAFAYIFNLVIGVGALALPLAFSDAGLVLGTLLVVALAFMSYMTTSYVIEAMAAANAYDRFLERKKRSQKNQLNRQSSDIQKADLSLSKEAKENTPLIPADNQLSGDSTEEMPVASGSPEDYEIEKKYEMGTMANMFYHPIGIVLYYVCVCVYLYGDLAIYAVTIPKSMQTILCHKSRTTPNISHDTDFYDFELNQSNSSVMLCFGSKNITGLHTYYICLAVTVVLLCPWTFFNLTRSKYLQLFTTVLRNIAFAMMFVLAIIDMASGRVAKPHPPAARFEGFPVLFGVSIYSFMCQHSLPGMITPMKSKKGVFWMTLGDYVLILFIYLLLAYTGAFRFTNLEDIYTLNFFDSSATHVTLRVVLGYYLALFPVFTLSTNFPIISITLRENLKALFHALVKKWYGDREFHFLINRIGFPILALVPAILIAFATTNVEALVSVTGSFPGVGVQYIIPVTLAIAAKYVIQKEFKKTYTNKYRSPFSYLGFFIFVGVWTILSVILIIIDDALKIKKGHFI